jgi:hydrogenase maturation protease
MGDTLILGVGNTLLTDEGAGVHAMSYLERAGSLPGKVRFLDAGTLSFVLADDIASAASLIIFDAAQLDAEAGEVRVFEGPALDEFLTSGRRSVHEVGFADLMDIARLQGCLPRRRALIGIQPGDFGWGSEPGDAVRAALPRAAQKARELLAEWAAESMPEVVNQ